MNKSIMECYLEGWKKTFVYKGQTTRRELFLFILVNAVIILCIAGISYLCLVGFMADHTSRGGMMLVWAWFVYFPLQTFAPLILLAPIISLGIRRMHDTGRSGWWFGGALLVNLFVLPLILTGIHNAIVAITDDTSGQQITSVISMVLNSIAVCYTLWLCCLPTKTKAQH